MEEESIVNAPGKAGWINVCQSELLVEGRDGVRFAWQSQANRKPTPAFVVRFDGLPRAYLNECRHVPVELDWPTGKFFDESGLYLVCATHGAMYSPDNGRCQGGPCASRGLRKLECKEAHGSIWVEQPSHGVN